MQIPPNCIDYSVNDEGELSKMETPGDWRLAGASQHLILLPVAASCYCHSYCCLIAFLLPSLVASGYLLLPHAGSLLLVPLAV